MKYHHEISPCLLGHPLLIPWTLETIIPYLSWNITQKISMKNHTNFQDYHHEVWDFYLLISWSSSISSNPGDFLWWMVTFTVNFHDLGWQYGSSQEVRWIAPMWWPTTRNCRRWRSLGKSWLWNVMNQLIGGTAIYLVWLPGDSYVFICVCQRIENRARKTDVFENVLVRY